MILIDNYNKKLILYGIMNFLNTILGVRDKGDKVWTVNKIL